MSINSGKNTRIAEKLSDFNSKVIYFQYNWVIENFSRKAKFKSPIFSPKCENNLKCFLKYDGLSSPEKYSLCIQPCNFSLKKIFFGLYISNGNDGTKYASLPLQRSSKSLSRTGVTEYDCKFFASDLRYPIEDFMSGKSHKIFCYIKLILNEICTQENNTRVIEELDGQLPGNLERLLESSKFSDVIININGNEFPAHKGILAACSRVFSAIFDHEIAEHRTVHITDIEPDVFGEMLKYIYTDKAPYLETMAEELLIAAEKYELERLKLKCEEVLCANLTIENAADTLIFAECYNATQLKERTMNFIATNAAVMEEHDSFTSMTFSHPNLILDVRQALINQR